MLYFVVSLPRTGTASVRRMADICGFKATHAPVWELARFIRNGWNFFADTPCYSPECIKQILATLPDSKFIYIQRDFTSWIKSWMSCGLLQRYNYFMKTSDDNLSAIAQYDKHVYRDVLGEDLSIDNAEEKHNEHFKTISELIPEEQLLICNFSDGWDTFCKFVNISTPNIGIPNLNKTGISSGDEDLVDIIRLNITDPLIKSRI